MWDALERTLHSGTAKTKAGQGGLVRGALFWKSRYATCVLACVILYHVTGSLKWRIGNVRSVEGGGGNEINGLMLLRPHIVNKLDSAGVSITLQRKSIN